MKKVKNFHEIQDQIIEKNFEKILFFLFCRNFYIEPINFQLPRYFKFPHIQIFESL